MKLKVQALNLKAKSEIAQDMVDQNNELKGALKQGVLGMFAKKKEEPVIDPEMQDLPTLLAVLQKVQ